MSSPYVVDDLMSTYRANSTFWPNFLFLCPISLLFASPMTTIFSSVQPILCYSCMCMRGKHSQYTRDIYFWHSKVMAERQAINLSAAFDEKGTYSTVSGSYCPSMCATFQTNVCTCRVLHGALFPLHYYK